MSLCPFSAVFRSQTYTKMFGELYNASIDSGINTTNHIWLLNRSPYLAPDMFVTSTDKPSQSHLEANLGNLWSVRLHKICVILPTKISSLH